jgi:hypothetical protein
MAQAASRLQPERVLTQADLGSLAGCGHPRGSLLFGIAAIVAICMLAVAVPSSFAQHGGGGGGHVGSGGGGGHFGGGGHSGGGGGHSSGGKSGHATGSASGARATKHGPGLYGVGANTASPSGKPRETGIGAAFRRFFGFSHSSSNSTNTRSEATATSSTGSLGNRAAAQASLPPAFSRLRLNPSPSPVLSDNAPISSGRAPFLVARPGVSAPPRPIGPRRRRFYPVGIGFYGFAPAFGFGFGAPFFGFNCFWFDCFGFNFDYYSYSAPWHYNVRPQATMLLYLTDGSAFEVTDYWVEGDTLRYIAEDGGGGEVPVSDVDVQRTTDANSRVGFRFNLDRTRRGTPLDRVQPPANGPDEPQSEQK